MKIGVLIMSIVFATLTFAGAGYVLFNHGQVSAGYAIVPMSISIVFLGIYRGKRKNGLR